MEYELIRSDRRSLSVQVDRAGRVAVRAPRLLPQAEIDAFVRSREGWIRGALSRQADRAAAHPEPDEARRAELIALAKEKLPPLIARWSAVTGLRPAALTITGAKTCFGSCSAVGRLSFSWRLMEYPEAAIEYVVVHELCHIVHHDHSPGFYALLARYLPDHKARRALLRR